MRLLKHVTSALLALAACAALAQTYPSSNPTYIPALVVPQTTISGTSTASVQVPTNGLETMYLRVAGSPSSFTAAVSGTESRDATPVWTTLSVTNVTTGVQQNSITATGLYRFNAAGLGQVRLGTSAISGTMVVSLSGGLGTTLSRVQPLKRATYTTNIAAAAPAASYTDLLVLPGNATNVARLTAVECTGQGTTTSAVTLNLIKYSIASTGGTTATTTIAKMDSLDPAAASVPIVYTANPSIGTSAGTLAVGRLITSTTLTPLDAKPVVWTFGSRNAYEQEVTLHGVTEAIAVNGNGATVASGTTLNCSMTWTEE